MTTEEAAARKSQVPEGKGHVTVKWLADTLGYNSAYISLLCKQGRIKAVKPVGGLWRIPREEADRIVSQGLPEKPGKEPNINRIKPTKEQRKQVVPDAPEPEAEEEESRDIIALPFLK